MILTNAILRANKGRFSGSGCHKAPTLLALFTKRLKFPPPQYHHKEVDQAEFTSKLHVTEVMARVPTFFYNSHLLHSVHESEKILNYPPPSLTEKRKAYIHGVGHCTNRNGSHNLAAYEALLQIEQMFRIPHDKMHLYLEDSRQSFDLMTNEYHFLPYDEVIPGITWTNIPSETSFARDYYIPADRSGNINFIPEILNNQEALLVAKAIILASPAPSPTFKVHFNRVKDGTFHGFANIQGTSGRIAGVSGTLPLGAANERTTVDEAQVVVLKHIYNAMTASETTVKTSKKVLEKNQKMIQVLANETLPSYGMAKLYVSLPLSRFEYFDAFIRSAPKFTYPITQFDLPSKSDLLLDQRPWDLVSQGLAEIDGKLDWSKVSSHDRSGTCAVTSEVIRNAKCLHLTHLGRALKEFSVEPHIARMLFLGLVLYAIDPALTIAALLSVREVFAPTSCSENNFTGLKSDVIAQMESYNAYIDGQADNPRAAVFDKVTQIRNQLESEMRNYIQRNAKNPDSEFEIDWNANSARVVVQAALICCATPRVAHLVQGTDGFATRDVAGTAAIHPSSVNHATSNRAYWYLYQELQLDGERPYLLTTTAVSPLEIALFCDSDFLLRPKHEDDVVNDLYGHIKHAFGDENWLYHVDRWIPIVTNEPRQRVALQHLRRVLMYDMMLWAARDPVRYARIPGYHDILHFVLSSLENQRIPPPRSMKNNSKKDDEEQSDAEVDESKEALQ
jgi:Helicase associated domain (HA2)